jgi:hypothetical protein
MPINQPREPAAFVPADNLTEISSAPFDADQTTGSGVRQASAVSLDRSGSKPAMASWSSRKDSSAKRE